MTERPTPGSREEAAQRREMGRGPFSGAKGAPDEALVLDAAGNTFARVNADECAGGDQTAALARARRIAEVLNAQEGHGKPVPYLDADGVMRAPAGYGFVARGEGCEMVPLLNVVMAPVE